MKVEENIKLTNLFDVYGPLLSEGQQKIMASYLYDDLTISEIAENQNISRQSVMDSISKGEKKLYYYEEKLNFLKRIETLKKEIEKLKNKK